ncbi:hypothetical protein MRX96_018287 [Rhipicephalus microplus]
MAKSSIGFQTPKASIHRQSLFKNSEPSLVQMPWKRVCLTRSHSSLQRSEDENNAEEMERKLREKALRSLTKARRGSLSCDDSQESSTAVFVAN